MNLHSANQLFKRANKGFGSDQTAGNVDGASPQRPALPAHQMVAAPQRQGGDRRDVVVDAPERLHTKRKTSLTPPAGQTVLPREAAIFVRSEKLHG